MSTASEEAALLFHEIDAFLKPHGWGAQKKLRNFVEMVKVLAQPAPAEQVSAEPTPTHWSFTEIGRKHFGRDIPDEWYPAARDLLEAVANFRAASKDEPVAGEQIVNCEDCNGTGVQGEAYGGSDFQPPERDECSSCNGSGKWKVPASPAPLVADASEPASTSASLKLMRHPDSGEWVRVPRVEKPPQPEPLTDAEKPYKGCREFDGRCGMCGGDWSVCGCDAMLRRAALSRVGAK